MKRPTLIIEADITPVCHAIERAAIRESQCPRDDMVARLDVILEEFANILGAYVAYRAEVLAARAAREPEAEHVHSPKPTVLQ